MKKELCCFLLVVLFVACNGNNHQVTDRAMYNLIGEVKSCTQGNLIIEFNRQGEWLTKDGDTVIRNDKNQIIEIKEKNGFSSNREYDAEGRVTSCTEHYSDVDECYLYTYENGLVMHENYKGHQGSNFNMEITYEYTKFDKHGNWIERKAVIKDFDDLDWATKQMMGDESEWVEKREISYY